MEAKNQEVLLRVENLCQYFGPTKAVDGVSFDIKKGEAVVRQRQDVQSLRYMILQAVIYILRTRESVPEQEAISLQLRMRRQRLRRSSRS